MTINRDKYNVGGIWVDLLSLKRLLASSADASVTCLILLHGRLGKREDSYPIAEHALTYAAEQASESPAKSELIVAIIDVRNHGSRLVDNFANRGWHQKTEKNNSNHAVDLYAMQTGTAKDVSYLIDFLPSYLYPNDERKVTTWAVGGVSLGGHTTWISLKEDERVTIGIPIIGCPDFLKLVPPRAAQFGLSLAAPTFPSSLIRLIKQSDPTADVDPTSRHPAMNPFVRKKILVLSGAQDQLVPWSASKEFVEALNLDEPNGGRKRVVVQEGAKHECTKEMVHELAQWVWEHGVKA